MKKLVQQRIKIVAVYRVAAVTMIGILPSLMLFVALFGNTNGGAGCNFNQFVQLGWSYTIQNVGFPQKYVPGSSCRWVARSEWDQHVKISCDTFDVPSNRGCEYDKLEIQDGDGPIAPFCGGRGFSYTSKTSRLTLTLVTSKNSPRGSFRCKLEAIRSEKCNCGIRNAPKIYGGEETAQHEFPFMAAILSLAPGTKGRLICGATIINKRQVLTAAHCLKGKGIKEFGVLVGAHNLNKVQDTPGAKFLTVENYILHGEYNRTNSDYDVALVTVWGQFEFNEIISPVCLPFQRRRDSFASLFADVLGWGADSITHGPQNVLMRARVGVTTPGACSSAYPMSTKRHMCTQEPKKDSCGYDSGGPVAIQSDVTRKVVQIGIINSGPSCGEGEAALNVRVGPLIDWIEKFSAPGVTYCKSE